MNIFKQKELKNNQLYKKVLIFDIDPQGNATSNVGVEKKDGIKTIYKYENTYVKVMR